MIEVLRRGGLTLVCASTDWRTFLPHVSDLEFTWAGRPDAHLYEWTWRWLDGSVLK